MVKCYHEMVTRVLKYLILAFAVALTASVIPSKQLAFEEALVIGLVAAVVFSVLDIMAPPVGAKVETKVGAKV
jgi:hypothetical protein